MSRFGRLVLGLVICLSPALMLCAPQGEKEITVEPEVLKQYVGTYELAPNFNIMITLEGNQLMAQASGQGKAPVFASSPTRFFYKVVDAQIEFFKDESEKVSYLVLYQNGRKMKAPRISDNGRK